MSCEGCLAARQAELSAYQQIKQEALKLANEANKPFFINKLIEGYAYSESYQPNTIEAVLPTHQ